MTSIRYADARMFNAKLNPCMLVMPHLLSISTSEASTAEQLAAKRDNEFITMLKARPIWPSNRGLRG